MRDRAIYTIIAVGLLACLAMPAAAMDHAVKIAEKPDVGTYLTDAKGMTLYWFKKDSPGQSACSGACVDNWPLYYRDAVVAPAELSADDFGTITRADGAKQTTFRGYPLYYFKGDSAPGEARGHDMKDVWYVVDPNRFPPE